MTLLVSANQRVSLTDSRMRRPHEVTHSSGQEAVVVLLLVSRANTNKAERLLQSNVLAAIHRLLRGRVQHEKESTMILFIFFITWLFWC